MARPDVPGASFALALSVAGVLCLLSPIALQSALGPKSPFELAPTIEKSYRAKGDDRTTMVADLEAFSSQLRTRGYDGLELCAELLDDETHNSVSPRALSNGLRFVFGSR